MAKRKKDPFFLQSLLGLIYWFLRKKVTIKRHRKLLRILLKKFFCDFCFKDIFFDARWREYIINQVGMSNLNVDFAQLWFRASFTHQSTVKGTESSRRFCINWTNHEVFFQIKRKGVKTFILGVILAVFRTLHTFTGRFTHHILSYIFQNTNVGIIDSSIVVVYTKNGGPSNRLLSNEHHRHQTHKRQYLIEEFAYTKMFTFRSISMTTLTLVLRFSS